MKRLFNELKEPIAKKEFGKFILEGLLISFLFATMLGVLRFFVYFTKFDFLSLFVFLIYYIFLTKRLRESFNIYHILYSILAVVFLIIGDYIIGVSGLAIELLYLNSKITLAIFNPIYHFSFLFYWPLDSFTIIINLLNIFIYGLIIYYTYQNMKRL